MTGASDSSDNAFNLGIGTEVARHGLSAIAEEMAIGHVRAAYSSVARELLDFSTAVCDGKGRVVAQGLSLPLQLGAIPRLMTMTLERISHFDPGDVYLVNHPWQGGVHLPDFFFIKPVFLAGDPDPRAFTVLVSHMVDVGGRFAGGISPSAASLWEEGLIIPLVPLVRKGETNQVLLDVIAANTRIPAAVLGDIRAALAGVETGARQFLELARRLGPDDLRDQMENILAATERATRAAFRRIPNGTATALDHLDDDGFGTAAQKLVCTIRKQDDALSFDFSGSAETLASGSNCRMADVMSVAAFAARAALGEDIPVNDGFTRCLEIHVPENCLLDAPFPAAVSGRGSTIRRLNDVAMAAMAELVPGRLPATPGAQGMVWLSGTDDNNETWILLDVVPPGWGGRAKGDGIVGLSHPIVNIANMPVELIEQAYPVRVLRYELAPDSGGAGMSRGAPSVVRDYEILVDKVTANLRLERVIHLAQGVGAGGSGSPSAGQVKRRGEDWADIDGTAIFTLNAGDRLRIFLCSGGGFGDPALRDPDRIERDRRDELITGTRAQVPLLSEAGE